MAPAASILLNGGRNAVGNIAIQYNYVGISVVLLLWDNIYGDVPAWSSSLLTSTGFLGSIVGMLTLGYLGDKIGRQAATTITLSLMAFGALASSLLAWGGLDSTCALIAVWRFIMGIGIGGVYPLSSASAFEGSADTVKDDVKSSETANKSSKELANTTDNNRMRAALAMFWQQPGQLLPYCFGLLLHAIYKNSKEEVQFRLILGVGCTFPLGVLLHIAFKSNFRFGFQDSKDLMSLSRSSSSLSNLPSDFLALMRDPKVRKPLLGCMICWALLDVYIYSIALYTPVILEKIFGDVESVTDNMWRNVISILATFPASMLSVYLLKFMSTRTLQLLGFVVVGVFSLMLACLWHYLESHSKVGLFILFLFQKNASSLGVPVATFILPNELFPKKIRSSCLGIAAAFGKGGAFVGCFGIPYVYDAFNIQAVFYTSAGIALIGALATIHYIPTKIEIEDEENEEEVGTATETSPLL